MEDAELVGAEGLTISTALDGSHYLIRSECSCHLKWFPLGFPRYYSGFARGRVSVELEVLNCWLNLVASCLDDENDLPLQVIASFSASRFALPSIPLIVLYSLVMSVSWSMGSTKSLHLFRMCTQMRFWMYFIQSWQFR